MAHPGFAGTGRRQAGPCCCSEPGPRHRSIYKLEPGPLNPAPTKPRDSPTTAQPALRLKPETTLSSGKRLAQAFWCGQSCFRKPGQYRLRSVSTCDGHSHLHRARRPDSRPENLNASNRFVQQQLITEYRHRAFANDRLILNLCVTAELSQARKSRRLQQPAGGAPRAFSE